MSILADTAKDIFGAIDDIESISDYNYVFNFLMRLQTELGNPNNLDFFSPDSYTNIRKLLNNEKEFSLYVAALGIYTTYQAYNKIIDTVNELNIRLSYSIMNGDTDIDALRKDREYIDDLLKLSSTLSSDMTLYKAKFENSLSAVLLY